MLAIKDLTVRRAATFLRVPWCREMLMVPGTLLCSNETDRCFRSFLRVPRGPVTVTIRDWILTDTVVMKYLCQHSYTFNSRKFLSSIHPSDPSPNLPHRFPPPKKSPHLCLKIHRIPLFLIAPNPARYSMHPVDPKQNENRRKLGEKLTALRDRKSLSAVNILHRVGWVWR